MQRFAAFFVCMSMVLPYVAFAETDTERRARLEAQLQQVERQILHQRVLVDNKKSERQSLERDLNIIDAEITEAQLGIRARTVVIEQLSNQIDEKEEVIIILNERLEKQRNSLAELIRKTQAVDDFSLVEVMLSNANFSEFFAEVESFRTVKRSLNNSLSALKEIKLDTQTQKNSLEGKQLNEAQMKITQEIEKKNIEVQEAAKERILVVTKGEEQAYQELLISQQKSAAQLKSQLFKLLGGGAAIPFPDAVAYAQMSEDMTGTPAALILAILEQESSYGSNIGGCTMGDLSLGKDIMHPDRDKPPFLAIAEEIGFDPATQQVSCPLRRSDGSRIGWGGAMGPSQFIPSTWAIYGGFKKDAAGRYTYIRSQDAIRTLLGKSSAGNPFSNQDAFLATGLLLRDNGANGNYNSDRTAALRYYAGWGGANNPENAFYGNGVMKRKARLDGDIRVLLSQ
ncbi:MAG: peptidoglycan hydrolase CwlO-like protein [Acidimicrobiales bacterium]|jgi:peptidoglycan hydrolase CwlO-like protein